MPGKKTPEKNRPVPRADDEAGDTSPIPSPFLQAGFDIGIDMSVHPPHAGEDSIFGSAGTAGVSAGQPGGATTTTTSPTSPGTRGSVAVALTTTNSNNNNNKRGVTKAPKHVRAGISRNQAHVMRALGLEEDVTPPGYLIKRPGKKKPEAGEATLGAFEATRAPLETIKDPESGGGGGETAIAPEATPSTVSSSKVSSSKGTKRTNGGSNSKRKKKQARSIPAAQHHNDLDDYDPDTPAYQTMRQNQERNKGRSDDRLEHRSDVEDEEGDNYLERVREFALRDDDEGDDEYLMYYHEGGRI